MAGKEKKKCEMCGNEKTVSSNNGKLVCSSCTVIQGAVNLRPKVVCDCLRDLHGSLVQFLTEDEARAAAGVCSGDADTTALLGERDELLAALSEVREIKQTLQTQADKALKDAELLQKENIALHLEAVELQRQIENLQIGNQAAFEGNVFGQKESSVDKKKLANIIGTICQGVVEKRMNVTPGVVQALRKLAA